MGPFRSDAATERGRYALLPTATSSSDDEGGSTNGGSSSGCSSPTASPLQRPRALPRDDLDCAHRPSPYLRLCREHSSPLAAFLHPLRRLLRPLLSNLPSFRLSASLVVSFFFLRWIYVSLFAPSPSSVPQDGDYAPEDLASLFRVSDDRHHRIFDDRSPGQASMVVQPVRAYDAMSDACVEQWVVQHRWTDDCRSADLSPGLALDGVWAWVNGSDPAQIASRHAYSPSTPLKMDAQHRYADHNELLYSMRSFMHSVGPDVLRRMHILASAYPLGDAHAAADAHLPSSSSSSTSSSPAATTGVESLSDGSYLPDAAGAGLWRTRRGGAGRPPSEKTLARRDLGFAKKQATSSDEPKKMTGQIPGWLSKQASEGNGVRIVLHHDADYFRPLPRSYEDSLNNTAVDHWRDQVIPSFNSLAVEAQIYNTPDTFSDQLVYLNDDFFTLRPNALADYSSPLFGPVIRSLVSWVDMYQPSESPFQRLWNPAGEEVGIKRAAWVLGNRFGMRAIPYIQHHPRTLWLPLLREAAQTFPSAFDDTTLARFRAQQEVPTSVQPFALASWYVVQRHREALLWSWVVAKHGGLSGTITPADKARMWSDLGGSEGSGSFTVKTPARPPVQTSDFAQAGLGQPLNTEYSFSSRDGYALGYLDSLWSWQRPRSGMPDLSKGLVEVQRVNGQGTARETEYRVESGGGRLKLCTLRRNTCFRPDESESADAVFKRIAFSNMKDCGDCAIAALMGASPTGIDVFLPEAGVQVPSGYAETHSQTRQQQHLAGGQGRVAHLPLTPRWRETDFQLRAVLAHAGYTGREPFSLRTWATRLIQRYQYVMGNAPSELYQMKYPEKVQGRLDEVSQSMNTSQLDDSRRGEMPVAKGRPLTFLCLNDDIVRGKEKIDGTLRTWYELHWPFNLEDEVPH